jgi:hypothetical protein
MTTWQAFHGLSQSSNHHQDKTHLRDAALQGGLYQFVHLIFEVVSSMVSRKLLVSAAGAAVLALGVAQPSQAAIFSDNFNSENGDSGALNYSEFDQWVVLNHPTETVDLIGNGFFDFYPGQGLYVDLDGSTSKAGVLKTKSSFGPGLYELSFKLGGSQRGSSEEVTVQFGSFSESFTLNSTDPLTSITRIVNLTGASNFLSFANEGGDNIGAILDDVNVAAIPTPALLPGLLGMGVATWRKRKAEAQAEVSEEA